MVKLSKYCWILLKYCKKIDLQPNIHLPHHEPPPSLIRVVNSRCTNPTRVHRSWLRVHDFTRGMERCFPARELVITRSRLQWNAALFITTVAYRGRWLPAERDCWFAWCFRSWATAATSPNSLVTRSRVSASETAKKSFLHIKIELRWQCLQPGIERVQACTR